MRILKCDRCGKVYYKNDDRWDGPLNFKVTWNYNVIDLCDDCYEKLQKWVDNTHDEQKECEEE